MARLAPLTAIVLGLFVVTPASAASLSQGGIFGALSPVSAPELAATRGTDIPIDFNSMMTATSSGNTVNAYGNPYYAGGSNFIGASSFSGASGVAVVVQNTGNNVIIQTATMVNVNFH